MTRWVVAFGFLVAFAAGYVVGVKPRQGAAPLTTRPSRHGGWLAAELKLTAEQQRQLDEIWSATAARGRQDREDRRRELMRERDEAIAALIPAEAKSTYEQIHQEFSTNMESLDREWKAGFQEAIEKTRQILSPEQRTKYERLLERHQAERGRHDRGYRGRDSDGKERDEKHNDGPR